MTGKVILLTGAPATGKSSLASALQEKRNSLKVMSFGKLLFEEKQATIPDLTYEQLRERSSTLITADDVASLDVKLLAWVANWRTKSHVLIDSHPVTKEQFGFRATPFNYQQVIELKLDAIICLYCKPEIVQQRIKNGASGRPSVSEFEILKHSQLQDGIASLYGVLSGCPIFYLDSDKPLDELYESVVNLLHLD